MTPRVARKKAALSQLQIAKKLKTTKSTVSKWENGHASPSLVAVAFYETLGVKPVDWVRLKKSASRLAKIQKASVSPQTTNGTATA